jgi:hypothetical protein
MILDGGPCRVGVESTVVEITAAAPVLLRHGGVVFGPHPRSYRQRMPKRMRRQAIRIALSGKVSGERVIIVQGLDSVEPKTKALAGVMSALGVTGSALLVMRDQHPEIANAAHNLPRIKPVRADLLNVLDLLRYDAVVMTTEAAQQASELWAETARRARKVKGATATAAAPEAKAPVVEEAPAAPEEKPAPRRRRATPKAEAAATPEAKAAPAPRRRAPRRKASDDKAAE